LAPREPILRFWKDKKTSRDPVSAKNLEKKNPAF